MEKFIDFHTHVACSNTGIRQIISLDGQEIRSDQLCSLGLHPWFLTENWSTELLKIKAFIAEHKNIIAFGECGLDKSCSTNFQLQLRAFTAQVKAAFLLRLPIYVHCVKAYNEVVSILKAVNITIPVIFHGFSGSKELMLLLLRKGYYLSFNEQILRSKHNMHLSKIYSEYASQILLESDSTPKKTVDIKQIYNEFSELCKVTLTALKVQQEENFKTIFGEI